MILMTIVMMVVVMMVVLVVMVVFVMMVACETFFLGFDDHDVILKQKM